MEDVVCTVYSCLIATLLVNSNKENDLPIQVLLSGPNSYPGEHLQKKLPRVLTHIW